MARKSMTKKTATATVPAGYDVLCKGTKGLVLSNMVGMMIDPAERAKYQAARKAANTFAARIQVYQAVERLGKTKTNFYVQASVPARRMKNTKLYAIASVVTNKNAHKEDFISRVTYTGNFIQPDKPVDREKPTETTFKRAGKTTSRKMWARKERRRAERLFIRGLSYAKIAAILGRTPSSVACKLNREYNRQHRLPYDTCTSVKAIRAGIAVL